MTLKTSLGADALRGAFGKLTEANQTFVARYPGEAGRRQPVHTVYGGGNLFSSETAKKLGQLAQRFGHRANELGGR